MKAICSITSVSHLYKTFVLADSLVKYGMSLHVLLIDNDQRSKPVRQEAYSSTIHWISLNELDRTQVTQLKRKYNENSDEFRWGLKPVLLKFLCQTKEQVCYVDNDIYFLHSPDPLFEKFEQNKILLTPHFYPHQPSIKGANWFEANFQVGVYNAGFVGVRSDAVDFLSWWFEVCLYGIRKSYFRGLFDDQKYLDLVPAIFQPVYVHNMPTWNYAAWNAWFPGIKFVNGGLFIDEYPVVFVHFATLSLQEFSNENHLANSLFLHYMKELAKYDPSVNPEEPFFNRRKIKNYLRYLHWRLLKLIQR